MVQLSPSDFQKLKKVELSILRAFIEICEAHDLKYFLLGGSCLGALRRQGFIPWDDDIDVGMLRPDYDAFMEIAVHELPSHLFLQNEYTEPDYPVGYAKIRDSRTTFVEEASAKINMNKGIYIDIFPLDGYKKSFVFDMFLRILSLNIVKAFDNQDSKKRKRMFRTIVANLIPDYRVARNMKNRLVRSRRVDKCVMLANYFGAYRDKEIFPKEYIGDGSKGVFEGIEIILPARAHECCAKVYGDYMTPPPVEKRCPHHDCLIIDFDKPYTDYQKESSFTKDN